MNRVNPRQSPLNADMQQIRLGCRSLSARQYADQRNRPRMPIATVRQCAILVGGLGTRLGA